MEQSKPKSKLNKLSPYALTNVLQFFDAPELAKYSMISRKFLQAERLGDRYIWKMLAN